MGEADIRVGLIGAGYIAGWHAGALRATAGMRLAGVCDSSAEAGEGLAAALGVPFFPTLAAMAAGVVLGEEGITGVSRAVELARRGRRLMRQNIGFAVAYNAAGLTLATLGAIPPVVAAAAMAASSLTVIANAARHGWRTTAQPTPPGAPSDQLLRQTA